jgi:hypothetical protein
MPLDLPLREGRPPGIDTGAPSRRHPRIAATEPVGFQEVLALARSRCTAVCSRARLIIVRSVVRIHPELFSHLRSFRLPYATPAQTGSEPQRRDRLNYSQPAYHVGVGGQGHCGEWPSCSASSGSGMPRLVLKRSQRVSGGTATCLRRLRVSGAMPSSLSRPSEPANVAGSDQN